MHRVGQGTQETTQPIKLAGLLEALKVGGLTQSEIMRRVRERGVDFVVVPEIETELRVAGASLPLVNAVKSLEPDSTKQSMASTYFDLGGEYYDKARYENAISAYRKALGVNPSLDRAALETMSQAYYQLGLRNHPGRRKAGENVYYDAAVECYRRAASIGNDPSACAGLGDLYSTLGRYDEAIEKLKQCVRLYPEYTRAYSTLAFTYRTSGHYEDAIEFVQHWITMFPDDGAAYHDLGTAYQFKKQEERALAAFKRAVVLDPSNEYYAASLADCYRDLGRLQEAVAAYQQSLKLAPTNFAHRRLGEVYEQLGDYPKALEAYRAALKDKYRFIDEYLCLGKLYSKLGQHKQAIATFKEGLVKYPDDLSLPYELGLAYLAVRDKRRAMTAYTSLSRALDKIKEDYDGLRGFEKDVQHAKELLAKIQK